MWWDVIWSDGVELMCVRVRLVKGCQTTKQTMQTGPLCRGHNPVLMLMCTIPDSPG